MAKKARKSGRGTFKLDLSGIDDYIYVLQEAPSKILSEIAKIAESFGQKSELDYASRISYANGFKTKFKNAKTFHNVENNGQKLRVNVGNTSFAAKFPEVGTKAHTITHKTRNGGMVTAEVRGQSGSKALYKAFHRNNAQLGEEISKAINRILTDR